MLSLSMGGFTILDWVEKRGCPLTCLQNLLIIEWNKEILTRFLGNKKACCWKGARIISIPFHSQRNWSSERMDNSLKITLWRGSHTWLPGILSPPNYVVHEETTTASDKTWEHGTPAQQNCLLATLTFMLKSHLLKIPVMWSLQKVTTQVIQILFRRFLVVTDTPTGLGLGNLVYIPFSLILGSCNQLPSLGVKRLIRETYKV